MVYSFNFCQDKALVVEAQNQIYKSSEYIQECWFNLLQLEITFLTWLLISVIQDTSVPDIKNAKRSKIKIVNK